MDLSSWGNYKNSTGNANATGKGSLRKTGYSQYWQANKIFDLAENITEWTQEAKDFFLRISRGAEYYMNNGSDSPTSFRDMCGGTSCWLRFKNNIIYKGLG